MKVDTDILVIEWDQSKWLVVSSFFFLLPSLYAFYNNLHFHSLLLVTTSLVSANYWRKACISWRRDLDLIFSKISFVVFFHNGVMYIEYKHFWVSVYCFSGYWSISITFLENCLRKRTDIGANIIFCFI
jgi:hypothetical protein